MRFRNANLDAVALATIGAGWYRCTEQPANKKTAKRETIPFRSAFIERFSMPKEARNAALRKITHAADLAPREDHAGLQLQHRAGTDRRGDDTHQQDHHDRRHWSEPHHAERIVRLRRRNLAYDPA